MLATVLLSSAAGIFVVEVVDDLNTARVATDERAPTPAAEAPAERTQPDKSTGRITPAADPAVSLQPYDIAAPFRVDDALTFGPDGAAARTRLAGLEGPSRDAVCFDETDALWACGLQGRSALHRLLGTSTARCRPTAAAGATVPAVCTAVGVDLGRELVRLGFARALDGSSPDQDEARQAGRGLWRGGWRIRPDTRPTTSR